MNQTDHLRERQQQSLRIYFIAFSFLGIFIESQRAKKVKEKYSGVVEPDDSKQQSRAVDLKLIERLK